MVEVVARKKNLPAAVGHAVTTAHRPPEDPDAGQQAHPVYAQWHARISGLAAADRPGLDAEVLAHVLLAALHSEPLVALASTGQAARLAAGLRTVAAAALDAPATGRAGGPARR